MSRTKIPVDVRRELWFRAHGRCEFDGCNKKLSEHGITFDKCDISNAAHIIADSEQGPRGNRRLSRKKAMSIDNLMLMCPECHKYIDHEGKDKYSVSILKEMKRNHEQRIELLTGITEDKKTLVVSYSPNIGHQNTYVNQSEILNSVMPERYPYHATVVELASRNSCLDDSKNIYWNAEAEQLCSAYSRLIQPYIADEGLYHISLFPLAPQPLLVKLGTIFNDKLVVDVYQRHREPQTWTWQKDVREKNPIKIIYPEKTSGDPVLICALSSEAIVSRVISTVSKDSSIWIITCERPGNDMLKTKDQLVEFRENARLVMEDINISSKGRPLKIFMSMPAAIAVELGRIRMPKADTEWILYDYNMEEGVDRETLHIKNC